MLLSVKGSVTNQGLSRVLLKITMVIEPFANDSYYQ